MATTHIDMQIGEAFHRQKRTLLLFATALILIAFAGDPNSPVPLGPVTSVKLQLNIVRAFLWIASLYYLFGFIGEALITAIQNRGNLDGTAIKSAEGMLAELNEQLTKTVAQVESAQEELEGFREQRRADGPYDEALNPGRPFAVEESTLENYVVRMTATISETRTSITNATTTIARISKQIKWPRLAMFWVWEVGGGVGAFVVATALNWNLLGWSFNVTARAVRTLFAG